MGTLGSRTHRLLYKRRASLFAFFFTFIDNDLFSKLTKWHFSQVLGPTLRGKSPAVAAETQRKYSSVYTLMLMDQPGL